MDPRISYRVTPQKDSLSEFERLERPRMKIADDPVVVEIKQ